jgi:hypothetical protein
LKKKRNVASEKIQKRNEKKFGFDEETKGNETKRNRKTGNQKPNKTKGKNYNNETNKKTVLEKETKRTEKKSIPSDQLYDTYDIT